MEWLRDRRCRAHRRLSGGQRCGRWASKGKLVCYLHGARRIGWFGWRDTSKARAAALEWFAQRRLDKAAGLPVVALGGTPASRLAYKMAKAEGILVAERDKLTVARKMRGKPPSRMTQAEKFSYITELALNEAIDVFKLPEDPAVLAERGLDPMKVKRMKMELTQSALSNQIKVDEATLRHVEHTDRIAMMREELKKIPIPSKNG